MATTSNRVGHPVRNRKRNRNIYNEDEETSFGPSNRISQLYASQPSTSGSSTSTAGNSTITNTGTASTSASSSSTSTSAADNKGSSSKGKQVSVFGPSSSFSSSKGGGSQNEYNNNNSSSGNSGSSNNASTSTSTSNTGSPSKANRFNKHIGAAVTTSLKTLLKLPKAHNWINHEFFYGNVDQTLFLDENEFSICLRDSLPLLRTRYLTRAEWSKIRRLLGKPRRCSAAFFLEERKTLNNKRAKIRHLQQNKVACLKAGGFKDLPEHIPHPLVVGTQVAALARVFDGLYYGTIEGIDSSNGTYRVAFSRPDVGSLSIPDYEVAPIRPPVFAPLTSFEYKPRKIWQINNRFVENGGSSAGEAKGGSGAASSHSHPQSHLLSHGSQAAAAGQHQLPLNSNGDNSSSSSSATATSTSVTTAQPPPEPTINGYPVKFLLQLVKASRTLTLKRKKVDELRAVNTEVERMTSHCERISFAFKKSYALSILELERINKDVGRHLSAIQSYSLQVANERQLKSLKPDVVSQKCLLESKSLVEQLSKLIRVGGDCTRGLIVNLMSLMFHLRGFRDSEVSCYEFQSIFETIGAIRRQISDSNVESFQNNVEIHIRHILSSVSHLGNVGVFSETNGNGNGSNGTSSDSVGTKSEKA